MSKNAVLPNPTSHPAAHPRQQSMMDAGATPVINALSASLNLNLEMRFRGRVTSNANISSIGIAFLNGSSNTKSVPTAVGCISQTMQCRTQQRALKEQDRQLSQVVDLLVRLSKREKCLPLQ